MDRVAEAARNLNLSSKPGAALHWGIARGRGRGLRRQGGLRGILRGSRVGRTRLLTKWRFKMRDLKTVYADVVDTNSTNCPGKRNVVP